VNPPNYYYTRRISKSYYFLGGIPQASMAIRNFYVTLNEGRGQ